ncbi:winged helix family transcriptional regulator [Kribbella qitaiheensis]|uniref:Winged helix family transcriptional regulator n=1 Tax=Kribbella qitaiheensis TaxID=1544730 RepID=A0A7G6WUQ6_9ACTN|nr:winged helix-turn-helix domain-containing protein [Kribbella qitaiheensis]QNE17721.1 winged helix family transcriptional regulator [Kribbella qitaiheensis]
MERLPDSSLIIGVATSTAERVNLARLLADADSLLLVSSAEQARAFLDLTTAAETTPVVLTPALVAAAPRGTVTAQIESVPLPASSPTPDLRPALLGSLVGGPVGVQASREALSRTTAPVGEQVVLGAPAAVEELSLDVHRRVVRWKDREISLTRLEHDFLHCLVTEPGRVWTYQRLHLAVWGNEHLGHGSHIHSVVKRLRQKLTELGAAVTIHAVRGVGFHLLPA